MRRMLALGLTVATVMAAAPVIAQEIVVTGTRIRDGYGAPTITPPAVTVPRRADNLIVSVWVVNDTRDATTRRAELIQTLRGMARAASGAGDIDLSIEEDGLLLPFTEEMVSTLTLGVDENRMDTSTASLIVKTPIRPTDTLDAASGRIEQFVARIDKAGRSLVSINGGWQLTIVDPAQYRPVVLEAIAADSRRTAAAFGDGYAVQVSGLSSVLTWVQSGPLDLSLYVPYQMTVTPRR